MEGDIFDESKLFSTFDLVENDDENSVFDRSRSVSKSGSVTELDLLKQENLLLKKLVRKLSFNPSEDEPFASILFYNSACQKQDELEDFICCVANKSSQNNTRKDFHKSSLLSDGFSAALGSDTSDLPVGCVQYFSSFCVDRFGSDLENISPNPPSYEKVYFKTLPDNTGGKVSHKRMTVCFNCDGDHRLNDCTKRRDLARINTKRRQFLEGKATNESRYHEEQTKLKQYQHLKPGIISNELREALGMAEQDLPPHIYRMRMLGYPPGWLPGNHQSGIVMYGKEGREEQTNEKVDSDDYVRYPGFNVPIPHGCKDLAYEVPLPYMQRQHQLEVKTEEYSPENEGRKRKASSTDLHQSKRIRASSDNDMEVEDDEPPGTTSVIENNSTQATTSTLPQNTELEDGEIADSPESTDLLGQSSWWLKKPLVSHFKKETQEFMPPPFPLRPLPLHKISQILPGELNHITFEDRSRWLDPIFGNLQVRTGRFDKLKKILAAYEGKRKSL